MSLQQPILGVLRTPSYLLMITEWRKNSRLVTLVSFKSPPSRSFQNQHMRSDLSLIRPKNKLFACFQKAVVAWGISVRIISF